jgi:DNA-binding IclR family transcriptional regulator
MKTVNRAIDLLGCFKPERSTLSVSEMAALLSVHKSIASRLAANLCARQMLELDPTTHRYRIGYRAYHLGQMYVHDNALEVVSEPLLKALTQKVGHASHVCVLEQPDIVIVCCAPSAQRLQVIVEVGGRRPVHATASGKLFLALGPSELLEALSPEGKFPKITPRTIESRAAMQRELVAIRKSGIARNMEESYTGAGAIAAPILGTDGAIIASLTTIFPLALVSKRDMPRIEAEVRETAKQITDALASFVTGAVRSPSPRGSS